MDAIPVLTPIGTSISVSVSTGSVAGVIALSGCDKIHVANTSATLYVSVKLGVGAPTAVLADDISIPPMGHLILGANDQITGVAAIGSAAGPTVVKFTPLSRGN